MMTYYQTINLRRNAKNPTWNFNDRSDARIYCAVKVIRDLKLISMSLLYILLRYVCYTDFYLLN